MTSSYADQVRHPRTGSPRNKKKIHLKQILSVPEVSISEISADFEIKCILRMGKLFYEWFGYSSEEHGIVSGEIVTPMKCLIKHKNLNLNSSTDMRSPIWWCWFLSIPREF